MGFGNCWDEGFCILRTQRIGLESRRSCSQHPRRGRWPHIDRGNRS